MGQYLNCRHATIQYDYNVINVIKLKIVLCSHFPIRQFYWVPQSWMHPLKSHGVFILFFGTPTMNEPQGLKI